ncbi:MAG TPA: hypothetical protein VMU95_13560 [Trebonia sp.]|nr:hypothetical protein [Trebonia sp.]
MAQLRRRDARRARLGGLGPGPKPPAPSPRPGRRRGAAATDEQGTTTAHAREYATLDWAGRVQLPRVMIRRLGIRNRVELQEESDHIGVWPDRPRRSGAELTLERSSTARITDSDRGPLGGRLPA